MARLQGCKVVFGLLLAGAWVVSCSDGFEQLGQTSAAMQEECWFAGFPPRYICKVVVTTGADHKIKPVIAGPSNNGGYGVLYRKFVDQSVHFMRLDSTLNPTGSVVPLVTPNPVPSNPRHAVAITSGGAYYGILYSGSGTTLKFAAFDASGNQTASNVAVSGNLSGGWPYWDAAIASSTANSFAVFWAETYSFKFAVYSYSGQLLVGPTTISSTALPVDVGGLSMCWDSVGSVWAASYYDPTDSIIKFTKINTSGQRILNPVPVSPAGLYYNGTLACGAKDEAGYTEYGLQGHYSSGFGTERTFIFELNANGNPIGQIGLFDLGLSYGGPFLWTGFDYALVGKSVNGQTHTFQLHRFTRDKQLITPSPIILATTTYANTTGSGFVWNGSQFVNVFPSDNAQPGTTSQIYRSVVDWYIGYPTTLAQSSSLGAFGQSATSYSNANSAGVAYVFVAGGLVYFVKVDNLGNISATQQVSSTAPYGVYLPGIAWNGNDSRFGVVWQEKTQYDLVESTMFSEINFDGTLDPVASRTSGMTLCRPRAARVCRSPSENRPESGSLPSTTACAMLSAVPQGGTAGKHNAPISDATGKPR